METKECCSRENHCKWSIWKWIGFSLLGIVGAVVFSVFFGLAIMWLWNCVMPGIFHLPLITFWEAVALAILARLLFGGFHHGHHGGWRGRKFGHGPWGHGRRCGGNWEKWNYYEGYWKEEGEAAFNDYVKRKTEHTENG